MPGVGQGRCLRSTGKTQRGTGIRVVFALLLLHAAQGTSDDGSWLVTDGVAEHASTLAHDWPTIDAKPHGGNSGPWGHEFTPSAARTFEVWGIRPSMQESCALPPRPPGVSLVTDGS